MISLSNIVFVMASHERQSITKQNVDWLHHFGEVVLVASYGRDLDFFKENTQAKVHIYPNNPLGSKWQFAVNKARELNPEILITVGSDDFLSSDYVDNALKYINQGYEFVGTNGWHLSDGQKHYRARYKHLTDFPAGSGRVYTKKALDKINWKLFDTKKNRLLDDMALAEMKKARVKQYISQRPETDGLRILAMKGDWETLNPLERFLNAPTIICHAVNKLPIQFPTVKL